MPAGNPGNTSFPNLAGLPDGSKAAEKLYKLSTQLRNVGADGAADRLLAVDDKIKDGNHDFAALERHIDPDRVADELNSARGRVRWRKLFRGDWQGAIRPLLGFPKSVRAAHLLRNVAALAPLIFTWIMLGLAARQYESDLKNDPKAISEPFLLLWQQGFGSGFRTFEQVTIIDFMLLALVVVLTFWVHWAEGQADRSADSVYAAVDSLKAVLAHDSIDTPLTAKDWARTATKLLSDTVQQTKELNAASERAIREASEQLESIQDTSHQFIGEFKDAVLQTLTSVTEQNEHFIQNTRETNQQVLQALVEQQMQPLLSQVQGILDQFKAQQADYKRAVTDLTRHVDAIQGSAAGLAASAEALTGSTESIAGRLTTMASAQKEFASEVKDSARSMTTAAEAMTGVKNALRQDLHERLQEMTKNITAASASLSTSQQGLERTTAAMDASARTFAGAMDASAAAFARSADVWAETLRESTGMLRLALSRGGVAGPRPRRRFWIFGRRS